MGDNIGFARLSHNYYMIVPSFIGKSIPVSLGLVVYSNIIYLLLFMMHL